VNCSAKGVATLTETPDSLWKVALGQEPPDTVIRNARVFDAVGGSFVAERSLWIKDGRIARLASDAETPAPGGVQIDAGGLTLVPGLIDGHTHVVRLFVPEFVRALLPTGVTGAVIETMEYGATEGISGVRLFIDALRDQPLRLYYTAPALCALTEDDESAPLTSDELGELLADPMCLGLGEVYWSNALLPNDQGRRVREMMAQTLAAGKVVEGHTAGAKGARLDAYVSLGVSSCHEPVSVEEALEVYSRGLFVMLRHGSIRRDLETLRPLFDLPLDFRRFALVTDSVDPLEMDSWGYLDQVVREALALGIPPHVVYRMASTNVAEHFRLESSVGHLAPGRWADLAAIPSPAEFEPAFVMVGGKTVAEGARVHVAARPVVVPKSLLTTVRVDGARALESAGPPPALPTTGRVRVIEYVTNLVTRETVLEASDATEEDLVPVLAIRRSEGGRSFWGLLKGLGLSEGAYATTVTWDSADLLVVGRDQRAALTALERVVELGGGGVYALGDDVVAEAASPVCGIASLEPAERVRADLTALVAALHGAGVAWDDPLLAVDTLTTPAIPHLRITHRGYVRLRDRALLPLEAEEG